MAAHIWSTITLLADAHFAGADQNDEPSMDLLLAEHLSGLTDNRQIWMVNTQTMNPGTCGNLLRGGYERIRDASESYIVVLAPGYADIHQGVEIDLASRQAEQVCRYARAFNKRVVALNSPFPPGCSAEIGEQINLLNTVMTKVASSYGGKVADLTGLQADPWGEQGSRITSLDAAAEIARAVLFSHASGEEWARKNLAQGR